jgi:hypothetical protein
MKTIKSINIEINRVKNEIDNLKLERKYIRKRDEVSVNRKNEIDRKIDNLKDELYSLNHLLWDTEEKINKVKLGIGYTITGLFLILGITGIVLGTVYKYKLGLYGFTTSHDVISILNGKGTVISVDLYNHLFLLKTLSSYLICFGWFGTLISGIWTTIWGLNNDVIG